MNQKTLKILLDYDCWPTWIMGEHFDNQNPASLGISSSLANALIEWSDAFDATLKRNDPADTRDLEAQLPHLEAIGLDLWQRLSKELKGVYCIQYRSLHFNKLYTSLTEYQAAIRNCS